MTDTRFDRELVRILEDLAVGPAPDYIDDVLTATARQPQRRPRRLPERWLSMELTRVQARVPGVPWRALGVLALLALLLISVLAFIGSRPRVPAPFGLARNGVIAYEQGGDIVIRDGIAGLPRPLIIDPAEDKWPGFSPDGTKLTFIRTIEGRDYLMLAAADGSNVTRLVDDPQIDAVGFWAPDSQSIGLVNTVAGTPQLSIVGADGSDVRTIDLGNIVPLEPAWRPPDGREILIRGRKPDGHIDLFRVKTDGSEIRALNLRSELLLGPDWDLTGMAWSPDGTRLAYNAVEADPVSGYIHFRLHMVNGDGSNDVAMPAIADPTTNEGWATWSPDGASILVARFGPKSVEHFHPANGKGWIAIMPSDGSAAARDIGPRALGGEETAIIKIWSPDGTRILTHVKNLRTAYSIDPVTGDYVELDWGSSDLPDWQRLSP